MTDNEQALWARLRGKQLKDIQFYRQRPIGHAIIDFYAPKAKLVVEVDGSQHFTPDNMRLLKKAASGVLAIFPCSRTGSTLCAQKWLRPCWTNFFEPPRGL